jgi:hypothetical protein
MKVSVARLADVTSGPRAKETIGVDGFSSETEQNSKAFANVCHDLRWCLCGERRLSRLPIEILHVIGQDDTTNCSRIGQGNLEGIPFYLTCDRARDGESGSGIVRARRQDQRRPAAALFMSGLWIKCQPDQIPSVRYISTDYHASWPAAVPQSLSPWRLRAVIRPTRSSRA